MRSYNKSIYITDQLTTRGGFRVRNFYLGELMSDKRLTFISIIGLNETIRLT